MAKQKELTDAELHAALAEIAADHAAQRRKEAETSARREAALWALLREIGDYLDSQRRVRIPPQYNHPKLCKSCEKHRYLQTRQQ